jgi:hypothetical protein
MAKSVKKTTTKKSAPAGKPAKEKAGFIGKLIKKAVKGPIKKAGNTVLYVDSSFFFPGTSDQGYVDDFQRGRYTKTPNNILQAPVLLPVGAKIITITMYYMNTTSEPMMFIFLKKHIDHHAPSGEVEVSFESMPPGTLAPDNFLEKEVNHFDNLGVIKDKYLYFIQIAATGKPDETNIRTVRGMRIEYQG